MVTGEERRDRILTELRGKTGPVSASALAAAYGVSRQVVVQDVALLRAAGEDILSTNRGYVLRLPQAVCRIFKVRHTDEQMEDELTGIVRLGGRVADVIVCHRVYGTLRAELGIDSMHKVEIFLENIRSGKSSPLKNITSDYHYHTVEADSEAVLDRIEALLKEKGYWVETFSCGEQLH